MPNKARPDGRSKYQSGKHVQLHEWMLQSAAYRSLSCYSRCLLVELGRIYNGSNNGWIALSVRDAAERLGVATNTALKAFRQLEDRGFIRPHEKGVFTRKDRHATTWVLTEHPYAGQVPTKEFMRWRPAKKQKPVSPGDTDGLTRCDTVSPVETEKPRHGLTRCDREARFPGSHGLTRCDTLNIPCGGPGPSDPGNNVITMVGGGGRTGCG